MELNFRIMRRIYRYILAVAAIAAAASCAENLVPESLVPENPNPENPVADNEVMPETLVSMVFTTSVDDQLLNPDVASKTTYGSRKVYWEETDNITVFSLGETETVKTDFGVKTLSDDKTTATFEGLADAQASAFYAVYPHHADNACDSGVLTVNLPSEQTAVANGFASGANVSVAYSENNGENAFKFRNATTLLCIKFTAEDDAVNTKSITFKAKKNETEYMGLAGQSQITLDSKNVPVVSEGNVQQVTLLAPEGGFVKDVIYYVPVYAVGECAGFEVTFTDLNGDDYTKTKNVPGSLDRNWLFNFGSIPNPYPLTFTVTLNFANEWPFNSECVAAEEQDIYATPAIDDSVTESSTHLGESYIYICTYLYHGATVSRDLEFKINKGRVATNSYSYINSALTFPSGVVALIIALLPSFFNALTVPLLFTVNAEVLLLVQTSFLLEALIFPNSCSRVATSFIVLPCATTKDLPFGTDRVKPLAGLETVTLQVAFLLEPSVAFTVMVVVPVALPVAVTTTLVPLFETVAISSLLLVAIHEVPPAAVTAMVVLVATLWLPFVRKISALFLLIVKLVILDATTLNFMVPVLLVPSVVL